jgi:hypothetical protein
MILTFSGSLMRGKSFDSVEKSVDIVSCDVAHNSGTDDPTVLGETEVIDNFHCVSVTIPKSNSLGSQALAGVCRVHAFDGERGRRGPKLPIGRPDALDAGNPTESIPEALEDLGFVVHETVHALLEQEACGRFDACDGLEVGHSRLELSRS